METATYEYPVALGLAYILLAGCVIRSIFVYFGLPASVGVMLSGFIFQHFFQNDLFFARDELQGLSFFLVLLIAGLEIRSKDLQGHIFVMALLPASFELLGIAVYAHYVLEYTPVEGMVLGSVLVAMGDGLVIPKMKEFSQTFSDHPLPRLVFAWAPLEASFALTAFGVLTGLASPAHQAPTPLGTILLANLLRLAATLVLGFVLGCVSSWFIASRQKPILQRLFHDPDTEGGKTEGFLILISVALIALSLGKGESGSEVVPMGFCPGSMFQSELLVIITASVFANRCCDAYQSPKIVSDINTVVGQVWVFGQVFLFSMLGSKMTLDILPELKSLGPVMVCGLLARVVGVTAGVLLTTKSRGRTCNQVPADIGFCFLCTLPRATIQGALGAEPLKQHFFHIGYGNNSVVTNFTFTAARLYVLCYSVIGMILLNSFGPMLLRSTEKEETQRRLDSTDSEAASESALLAESPSAEDELSQQGSSTPQLEKVASRSASSVASGESHWQDQGGMLHTFESKNSTWRPSCEVLKGYKTTCRATASKQRPPGLLAEKVFKPEHIHFKVPERSTMQRLLRPRGRHAEGRLHTVKTPQGDIPLVLSSNMKPGQEEIYHFGPDPDFLIRADPAPHERPMTFQLRTAGKLQTIKVIFPPRVREVEIVPDAVMVKVPDGAKPGAALVLKHPNDNLWLRTQVPQKVPATGFVAVALPSLRYQPKSEEGFNCGIGELCREICTELDEALEVFASFLPFQEDTGTDGMPRA